MVHICKYWAIYFSLPNFYLLSFVIACKVSNSFHLMLSILFFLSFLGLASCMSLKSSIVRTKVPKLIAFDLDGTIWHPEMNKFGDGGSPFAVHADGSKNTLLDKKGTEVRLLGASSEILHELVHEEPFKSQSIVCWVSRCDEPGYAAECLSKFTTSSSKLPLDKVASAPHNKIFQKTKNVHFTQLAEETGLAFEDMIFFDNEMHNIHDVAPLGVLSVYCPDGVTREIWEHGLDLFEKREKQ